MCHARRHFGIPLRTQPRPTYSSLTAAGAWSGGSAFTVAIVIILMVLGVVLYGLSKIVGRLTLLHQCVKRPAEPALPAAVGGRADCKRERAAQAECCGGGGP